MVRNLWKSSLICFFHHTSFSAHLDFRSSPLTDHSVCPLKFWTRGSRLEKFLSLRKLTRRTYARIQSCTSDGLILRAPPFRTKLCTLPCYQMIDWLIGLVLLVFPFHFFLENHYTRAVQKLLTPPFGVLDTCTVRVDWNARKKDCKSAGLKHGERSCSGLGNGREQMSTAFIWSNNQRLHRRVIQTPARKGSSVGSQQCQISFIELSKIVDWKIVSSSQCEFTLKETLYCNR